MPTREGSSARPYSPRAVEIVRRLLRLWAQEVICPTRSRGLVRLAFEEASPLEVFDMIVLLEPDSVSASESGDLLEMTKAIDGVKASIFVGAVRA